MERDPEAASAQHMAQLRRDLGKIILRKVVDAVVRTGPLELPFDKAHQYFAFVDPDGGGQNEFCLAIDHAPGGHDDRANVVAGLVSTKAASSYDLELFINGRRASDEKSHTFIRRRPVIEALRQAGIPLN